MENSYGKLSKLEDTLSGVENIFFIGIGGISMSSLAMIAKDRGYTVSGSDRTKTPLTESLEENGITVYYTHSKDNIKGADAVVYTAAISDDNPEIQKARELGIPLIYRGDFLGHIMSAYKNRIGISGMHGKSTTTSMLSHVLLDAGLDPTVVSGAQLEEMGGAYRIGSLDSFVFEACEYKDSFLCFYPSVAVVLNIDLDHLDYFSGLEQIEDSFLKFINKADTAVLNFDNDSVRKIAKQFSKNIISFGIYSDDVDFKIANVDFEGGFASYDVFHEGKKLARIKLAVPGEHSITDSAAAFVCALISGADPQKAAESLGTFRGAKRRFEYKKTVDGVDIFDDYAHHPEEIRNTLKGVKKLPYNRVFCIFQPHTYSRTAKLLDEFSESFEDADRVILQIFTPQEKKTSTEFRLKNLQA